MYDQAAEPLDFWDARPEEITRDLLARHDRIGTGFWIAAAITGVLFLIGIIGFLLRLSGGFQDRAAWGYYAATFGFLLTIVGGAPMVAIGMTFAKAHMRRPVASPSGLFAVVGILVFLLFIPLLWLIPPVEGHHSLWMGIAIGGAPYTWDTLSLGGMVLAGLAFLWVMSRPDLDAIRQAGRRGRRTRLSGILAGRWTGSQPEWWGLKKWMVVLGFLYFVALILTHTLLSVDTAMGMVPGWRSAIFPPYNILTSLQGGVAATILALGVLRLTGYRSYLVFDQFWGLGKIMFSLGLLGIYFTFADFVTLWYGRTPREMAILELTMFGPYLPVFVAGFFFAFFGPLLAMIWNQVRQSILGPTLVAGAVLLGLFLDRIRLYVAAYSAAQVSTEPITQIPAARGPDGADIMMMIGLPAGAILVYLLASRVIPAVSIWQIRELALLRNTRRYFRARVVTMAKPD